MEPAPQPPPDFSITPDVWARLKRLDRYCHISMSRRDPYTAQWRHAKRTWHICIHDTRGKAWESVNVEHPRLADALLIAVTEAERFGWHQDVPTGVPWEPTRIARPPAPG